MLCRACLLYGVIAHDFASLPEGWAVGERAAPSEGLALHVFVAHDSGNITALTAALHAAADPRHPATYGKWLTFGEVNDLATPAPRSSAAVAAWLGAAGVPPSALRRTGAGDIVEAHVNVSTAEALLPGAQYRVLTHAARPGLRLVRTARYALPASLVPHVDFVSPTTRVPALPPPLSSSAAAAPAVYPPGLRARYGATGVSSASANNSFAVVGFLDQYFDPADAAWFFSKYDAAVSKGKKVAVHGPNSGTVPSSGEEATLDVTYGAAMAAGIATTFWSTKGRMPGHGNNEPFAQWLMEVASAAAPPLVFSISYSDDEYTVDAPYAARVNVELQKAGARGITIVASSGDGGVGGTQPNNKCKHFLPTFPPSSPYVTAVGGTGATKAGQTASTVFPSGGGFSSFFGRPSYQDKPVAAYLAAAAAAKTLPSATLFNGTSAGYPDVSLLAENYILSQYKVPVPVSGTSCSTPAFGALVALLNGARLSAGKPSLGWLNPLLYAHAADDGAFTDIVAGSNPGCAVNSAVGYLGGGFSCAPGWDPLTGLGTINFAKWQQIVGALP